MRFPEFLAIAALAAATWSIAAAQSPSAADQAVAARKRELALNRAKLTFSVTLDRDIYFPGEDAQVTIGIVNPTAQTMEIPEPFNRQTGGICILRPGTGAEIGEWVYASNRVGGWGGIEVTSPEPPPPPAVWIAPNQPLEKTLWLSESCARSPSAISAACQVTETEGLYRMLYDYDPKAYAQYQVVSPQLEQMISVQFEKRAQFRDISSPNGKTMIVPRLIRFAVLGYQGTHALVVSREEKTGPPPKPDTSGKLTGLLSRDFSPFRRIATSEIPITSLNAIADSSENITVTYVDQTGKTHSLKLNANRDLAP